MHAAVMHVTVPNRGPLARYDLEREKRGSNMEYRGLWISGRWEKLKGVSGSGNVIRLMLDGLVRGAMVIFNVKRASE